MSKGRVQDRISRKTPKATPPEIVEMDGRLVEVKHRGRYTEGQALTWSDGEVVSRSAAAKLGIVPVDRKTRASKKRRAAKKRGKASKRRNRK